jgi:hypothetical protein
MSEGSRRRGFRGAKQALAFEAPDTDGFSFALDGSVAIGTSARGRPRVFSVWDPSRGVRLRELEGESAANAQIRDVTRDGRFAAATAGRGDLLEVTVWHVPTGERCARFAHPRPRAQGTLGYVRISPDGRRILVTDGSSPSAPSIVWDLAGREPARVPGATWGTDTDITSAAFVADGRTLVTGGDSTFIGYTRRNRLAVRDLSSSALREVCVEDGELVRIELLRGDRLALSFWGNPLGFADVRLADLATGACLWTACIYDEFVSRFALTLDDERFAIASNVVLDLATGAKTEFGAKGNAYPDAISRDGCFAWGAFGAAVHRWELDWEVGAADRVA